MDDNLRRKLAALKDMANGKGTTEEEAMAAAAKMAAIMRDHGLTDDDLEFDEAEAPMRRKRPGPRTALIGTIAVATNCAGTIMSDATPCVVFLGNAPGPQIAAYLHVVCDRAIDTAVAAFKNTPEYARRRTLTTKRAAVQDFTTGMVARLCRRIFELFETTMDDARRKDAARARDLRLPGSRQVSLPSRKVRFSSAASEGYAAGQRVQLSHGMETATAAKALLSR